MKSAAMYLRSSKDRSDVSIAAQRRQLAEIALKKGLAISAEYSDSVESGKTIHRPAFQELLQAIKDKGRGWSTLLVLDTSRIMRGRFQAQAFKHQCKRKGIEIIYASLPDLDPITGVIVESVFEAMDEVHSLLSKQKGLAGMAENVRQGFRAGGRAPFGYALEHIETGAIRDGRPVTKSKLVLSEEADKVRVYLSARASKVPRTQAVDKSGIALAKTTLIGIEWNALTYSGATVWNVHAEKSDEGGYVGGKKRRPRSEWIINSATHQAIISAKQAEDILAQLESASSRRAVKTKHAYLLNGILTDSGGNPWHGDQGKYYAIDFQGKKKRASARPIDKAVLAKIAADLKSNKFVSAIVKAAKKQADPGRANAKLLAIGKEIDKLNVKISKLMTLSLQLESPEPALREVDATEAVRKALLIERSIIAAADKESRALEDVSEIQVKRMLVNLAESMEGIEKEKLKRMLSGLVEKIILDPGTDSISIHYQIRSGGGAMVASPRVCDPGPTIGLVRRTKIA